MLLECLSDRIIARYLREACWVKTMQNFQTDDGTQKNFHVGSSSPIGFSFENNGWVARKKRLDIQSF